MEEGRITITNEIGLHARPAARFVSQAARYDSEIKIQNFTKGSKWVNAKSIMSVLSLGVESGNEISMTAEGIDEQSAMKEMLDFVATII